MNVLSEDEYFPPPPELRKLLDAVGALLSFSLGGPFSGATVLADDRSVQAVDVLDTLIARWRAGQRLATSACASSNSSWSRRCS